MVKPSGIITEANLRQHQNALQLIFVTVLGISIEVKDVHSLNACCPIEVTPLLITAVTIEEAYLRQGTLLKPGNSVINPEPDMVNLPVDHVNVYETFAPQLP